MTRARIFWNPFLRSRQRITYACGLSIDKAERVCDGENMIKRVNSVTELGIGDRGLRFLMPLLLGLQGRHRKNCLLCWGMRVYICGRWESGEVGVRRQWSEEVRG